ncbi:MAG: FkbM family methyltransferase [Proteobacteria bacterium]|nr:FkbM family methyltransferase [Pseudomonadota bacterium]
MTQMPKSGETIVHIGANNGHEVNKYEEQGLTGYHVEAIPRLYEELRSKCEKTTSQIAIQACLADTPNREIEFNVASNNGESSSLLSMGRHKLAYPHIEFNDVILLTTTTLDELIKDEVIRHQPNHLVIDVQGAELLVLKGCTKLLSSKELRTLTVECFAVPLYKGGASLSEVVTLLESHQFYLKKAEFNFHGWCDVEFSRPWWPRQDFELEPPPKGKNIATDSHCTQSSVSRWSTSAFEANMVVVGIRNGSYAFHTAEESHPWLIIDLKSRFHLSEIIIFNRIVDGDDVAARAESLEVYISDEPESWTFLHGSKSVFGGIDGYPLRISCNQASARYLKFCLGSNDLLPLHLDTIEVYAVDF